MDKLIRTLLKFNPSPFHYFIFMSVNTLIFAGILNYVYNVYSTMPHESAKHIILTLLITTVCLTSFSVIILKNLLNDKYYE